jgi:uncharacterized protein (DUF2336 family)
MSSLVSFVMEVEDAVASKDPARRVETLRRLAGLFVDQEATLPEGAVEVFDEVILRLSRDLEQRARMDLSETFSTLDRAPRKVVRSLAFDLDAAIARPVLERSSRLDEDDLVMIARARGQDHLLAISRRAALSERVTDVLVHRGDGGVVRSVAGNAGARFSEGGFSELMDRARADEALQGLLRGRGDIPPRQLARLVEIAQEQARRTLTREFGADRAAEVGSAVAAAAGTVTAGAAAGALDAAAAVRRKAEAGGLFEDDVLEWLRLGRIDEALAAIAQLAGVPVGIVAKAYRSPHHDPLLFLVRAVRFGWATFKALLAAQAGRPPAPETLRGAFAAFQQLSVQTAQRVVRFTAARDKLADTDAA